MVLALINTVFAQETAEAAHGQWRVVADQLREKFPKLALMLDGPEGDVLAFMDFPKAHRKQIASTNPNNQSRSKLIDVLSISSERHGGPVVLLPTAKYQIVVVDNGPGAETTATEPREARGFISHRPVVLDSQPSPNVREWATFPLDNVFVNSHLGKFAPLARSLCAISMRPMRFGLL